MGSRVRKTCCTGDFSGFRVTSDLTLNVTPADDRWDGRPLETRILSLAELSEALAAVGVGWSRAVCDPLALATVCDSAALALGTDPNSNLPARGVEVAKGRRTVSEVGVEASSTGV
jgi:hypothetical protein